MTDAIVVAGGDSVRRSKFGSELRVEQYEIRLCRSLEDFSKTLSERNVTVILLLYPDTGGFIDCLFASEIIIQISGIIPLVLISSSPLENNLARSIGYKADEFLIEPVSNLEIANLIHTSLSSNKRKGDAEILKIGDLVLDRTSLAVTLRTVTLPLHPIQVRILELLMLNPGRAYTRKEILHNIWRPGQFIDDRTIDVTIGRIRSSLRHKVSVDPVRTIRGIGYAFNDRFDQIKSLPKKGSIMKRAQ